MGIFRFQVTLICETSFFINEFYFLVRPLLRNLKMV